MDKFYKKQYKIFRGLRDSAISAIGIDISELIFDTTSVFFRVAEFTVDDKFRRHGNSKDKRPDLLQVVLAVCTNSDGFPLYYRAYPGNTSDFHAFKNFLHDFNTEIKPIHKGGVVWIIFDKGNTSKKTILKLDQISESFPRDSYLAYLASIKLSEDMLNKLKYADTCQIDEREYKVAEMFTELGGGVKRVLIVYDPKLKGKQVVKLEKKFQAVRSELDKILQNEKDKVKCITKLSAIIRKNKLTAIFKVKETDNGIVYEEDKSAKERKLMKARTFAVITNNFTSSKSDMVRNYIGRNRVEQTIWELKNLIPVRPVFHQLKRRIKTHAFLVMVGYLLLSTTKIFLQKRGLNMTMENLLSVLQSGYIEIIEWSKSISIEYPKNVSSSLEKIYEKFGIPILKI
jgi:transposase